MLPVVEMVGLRLFKTFNKRDSRFFFFEYKKKKKLKIVKLGQIPVCNMCVCVYLASLLFIILIITRSHRRYYKLGLFSFFFSDVTHTHTHKYNINTGRRKYSQNLSSNLDYCVLYAQAVCVSMIVFFPFRCLCSYSRHHQ